MIRPGSALDRLHQLVPRGADLGLARVRDACAKLGHPELAFEVAHVAGTNGKGSASAMLAEALRCSGRRVGLYSSPHLCVFAERIRIDGVPIDDATLDEVLAAAMRAAPEATFFEAATLAAFIAFARAGVDVAVLEVGLGGRLDATNILERPRVTAITRIALDHTDRLGPDLASIAAEKGAIAKQGVPLVLGALEPEALAPILRLAEAAGAPVVHAHAVERAVRLARRGPIGLAGAHQIDNAIVAAAAAVTLGLDDAAIARGLAEVRWPGRLETLETPEGQVLLDAAHNVDGASALAAHLAAHASPATTALVFGAMADKDWPGMLAALAPRAAHRLWVTPEGRRAADPRELAARFGGEALPSVADALARARALVGPHGLVVVAGSIFLVGEARARLLGLDRDPAVAL